MANAYKNIGILTHVTLKKWFSRKLIYHRGFPRVWLCVKHLLRVAEGRGEGGVYILGISASKHSMKLKLALWQTMVSSDVVTLLVWTIWDQSYKSEKLENDASDEGFKFIFFPLLLSWFAVWLPSSVFHLRISWSVKWRQSFTSIQKEILELQQHRCFIIH